jgi:sarcosine oxidase, subunit gamma
MPEPIAVRLLPAATRLVFQGGAAARDAAGLGFGLALPEESCRARADRGRAALWLGPDEQLLLAPAEEAEAVLAALAERLAGMPHSLVEVSQRQVAVSVRGAAASDLLNAGCPLDLDPAAFPAGACTRTILGKAEVVLWRLATEEYHLEVPRSFSGYVLGWLAEAGQSEHQE